MSSWLKRQQPIQLYQGSDVPYVILKDGVHLCFDNCFGTHSDGLDHNLCFQVEASALKRINTNFYKFSSFPCILPFVDIVSLDDAVIEGRTIKQASETQDEPKSIAIMKTEYIHHNEDLDLSSISDILCEFDKSFILVGENIDPQARLFEDISTIVPHSGWAKTIVTIADAMCDKSARKYCWTNTVPELSISCYGIDNSDELIEINDIFHDIGVNDVSINWVG